MFIFCGDILGTIFPRAAYLILGGNSWASSHESNLKADLLPKGSIIVPKAAHMVCSICRGLQGEQYSPEHQAAQGKTGNSSYARRPSTALALKFTSFHFTALLWATTIKVSQPYKWPWHSQNPSRNGIRCEASWWREVSGLSPELRKNSSYSSLPSGTTGNEGTRCSQSPEVNGFAWSHQN